MDGKPQITCRYADFPLFYSTRTYHIRIEKEIVIESPFLLDEMNFLYLNALCWKDIPNDTLLMKGYAECTLLFLSSLRFSMEFLRRVLKIYKFLYSIQVSDVYIHVYPCTIYFLKN